MSLRPELAFGSTIELPPNEKIGDLAKNCPVLEVDQRGLTIKIGDSNGVVPFKHLNEKPSDLKAKFTNSQVTVRILQYDFFEQVFVCSMQKSFLEQSVIKLDQLKPGDIVNHCKIKKFADKGVIVEVGRGLDGFVPYFQLSDVPLKNPEKKFSIGDKIKCRVLKLDPRKRKLHLTHKKLLVENEFEIVDDFDSKFIGKITEGVVVQTSNEGVLLQLFGK